MKVKSRLTKWVLLILFIGFSAVSCSTKPYININYRVPSKSDALEGRSVFLSFKDIRPDQATFSDKAQKEFRQFTGKFSFSLTRENENILHVGAFDIPELFKTAFSSRLENLGINVSSEQQDEKLAIEIELKSFFLDLAGGKWFAQISYETLMVKDGKIVARQTTSGSAERFKMVGNSGADKVLEELFTDVINEPDILKLFYQAPL